MPFTAQQLQQIRDIVVADGDRTRYVIQRDICDTNNRIGSFHARADQSLDRHDSELRRIRESVTGGRVDGAGDGGVEGEIDR